MTEKTFQVPDVSCEHCVKAITDELSTIEGVEAVTVDLDEKTVTVSVTSAVSDDQIIEGLDEAGYDVAA